MCHVCDITVLFVIPMSVSWYSGQCLAFCTHSFQNNGCVLDNTSHHGVTLYNNGVSTCIYSFVLLSKGTQKTKKCSTVARRCVYKSLTIQGQNRLLNARARV